MKYVCLAIMVGLSLVAPARIAAEGDNTHARLIASPEGGWPQWRGPRRDGISTETGLLPAWPENGPKLRWSFSGLGRGYSCPIISDGKLFITGDVGEDLVIFALNLEGKLLWQAKNGRFWKDPYPGARACVAFSEGRIYHMNAHGRVAAFAAATGKEIWAVEVLDKFHGRNITWGLAECLLVDRNKVIATPGGEKALMVALNKANGETIWASEPLLFTPEQKEIISGDPGKTADSAGYTSPVLFELGGRRHLVNCSQQHAFGADADSGRLLWQLPMPTSYKVLAATPAVYRDAVFITGPDAKGGTLFRINNSPAGAHTEATWLSRLDTCHGGVLFIGDRLYGSLYRNRKGWACLDAATGEMQYQTTELNKGSMIHADGQFYLLSEDGIMALVKAGASRFEFTSKFQFVNKHKNDVWAHPVILDGRLYLRYHDTLYCYDIKQK